MQLPKPRGPNEPLPSGVEAIGAIVFGALGLSAFLFVPLYFGGAPPIAVLLGTIGPPVLATAFFGPMIYLAHRAGQRSEVPPIDAEKVAPPAQLPATVTAPIVIKRPPTQACPRCARKLLDEENEARPCPHGCGALLTTSGVEHVLARAQLDLGVVRELTKERGVEKHACPSCGASMRETELRGLRVDLCLSCGSMWLDDGERARLAREDAFAAPAPA